MKMKKVLFLMNITENNGEYSPAIFNWYGVLEKLGYEVFYEDYRAYTPDEFYNLVKANKPDYIFHPTYEGIHFEFHRLREFSKVFVIHSDDDWRFDNYSKFWIPFTDGAIGYQNHSKPYVESNSPDNYYIRARWAFNPNTMHHIFDEPKKYNVSHVGGLHGRKDEKINYMKSNGIDVVSIDPKFSSYSLYLKSFHQSKISLCFTNNSLGTASQSKTRVGEMPFYCVLASEAWPNMELWNMEPNKDFILLDFSNTKYIELFDKILTDETAYNTMYMSAKNILLNYNTVFHEWDRIMSHIDEDYKKVDVNKIIKNYSL